MIMDQSHLKIVQTIHNIWTYGTLGTLFLSIYLRKKERKKQKYSILSTSISKWAFIMGLTQITTNIFWYLTPQSWRGEDTFPCPLSYLENELQKNSDRINVFWIVQPVTTLILISGFVLKYNFQSGHY